jgi:hypothetical protein
MNHKTSEFMQLLTFNKQERGAMLSRDTSGMITLYLTADSDDLKFDVTGTGCTMEIASRQVDKGRTLPETSRVLLRDHAECKNWIKYSSALEQVLIVGIVTDKTGAPVLTFEAQKTKSGWNVFGKKYTYMVDKPVLPSV